MPPKEEPQSKEEAQPVLKQARQGWFLFIDDFRLCFLNSTSLSCLFCALLSLLEHYSVHFQIFYSIDSRCIDPPSFATVCSHLSVKRGLLCGCKLTPRRVKIETPATGNATQRGGTTIQRRGSAGLEAGTPGVICMSDLFRYVFHSCIRL